MDKSGGRRGGDAPIRTVAANKQADIEDRYLFDFYPLSTAHIAKGVGGSSAKRQLISCVMFYAVTGTTSML